MVTRKSNRTARVEARIAPDALAVVRRAAELQGRSISVFRVAAVAVSAWVVDAKDDAAQAFYRHHGFQSFGIATGQLIS